MAASSLSTQMSSLVVVSSSSEDPVAPMQPSYLSPPVKVDGMEVSSGAADEDEGMNYGNEDDDNKDDNYDYDNDDNAETNGHSYVPWKKLAAVTIAAVVLVLFVLLLVQHIQEHKAMVSLHDPKYFHPIPIQSSATPDTTMEDNKNGYG